MAFVPYDGLKLKCRQDGAPRTLRRDYEGWYLTDDEGPLTFLNSNWVQTQIMSLPYSGAYELGEACWHAAPYPAGSAAELNGRTDKHQAANPGDWLNSLSSTERKEVAVSRGLFAYFPDALALIARHSVRGNEKHNPGQPVHWVREKSADHEDCIGRHSLAVAADPDSLDGGEPHIVCRAWRALAALQIWAEAKKRT